MTLERCTRCTLPITWETLYFDEDGVCNICHNWQQKQHTVNWEEREQQFLQIAREAKALNKEYDCILPFSGGKDSTYTLWAIVKKYGLKPLVVSFDHHFYRPRTLENRTRTFRKLGVDVITFTPNWHIVKKLMLESLIRKGDFCWHCHAGVFSYPMQIAVKYEIPLIIWGEGGGEYEGYFKFEDIEQTDEWKYNRRIILGMRAEDVAGFIGVEPRDLTPYTYPPKADLDRIGVKSVPLGNYVSWDVQKHVEINKSELGWLEDEMESAYPGETYEKIECMFEGLRDYVKYIKRGFSRMTHLTTLDIRHGRFTREKAMEYIERYEGKKPQSLQVFLEYLEITEEEFNAICVKHLIPPAQPVDPATLPEGKKLWDQDLWFRDNLGQKEQR
jgi:N-acetyl sugar amidotransferase